MPRSDPEPRRSSWRIDIGPLPARWRRAGFALLCLLLTWVAVSFGLRTTRLDCLRELGRKPTCTLSDSPPLPHVDRFPPGSIARITESHESPGKGPGYWTVMILDQRGAERRVASYDAREAATALGDRIRAYLADPRALRFTFAPVANHVKLGLCAAIALLVAGVLLRNAFHQAGHLLVDVDRVHGELRVRRRLFGVPRGRQARYALAELIDLQLERGVVPDKLLSRGQLPSPGARLVLVRAGGHRYPLTPGFLPGPALFEKGLELLRAELGLTVDRDGTAHADRTPPAAAPHESPTPPVPWAGAATGLTNTSTRWLEKVIVGVGVVMIAVLLFSWNANKNDGWLEIRAEYRCLFDGIELLPGGDMSMSLRPGRYEIRVFDSAAPGGWQSQFYELKTGQSLVVTCRPTRSRSR